LAQTPKKLFAYWDISDNDISAKDSATGLVQRNGNWETIVNE